MTDIAKTQPKDLTAIAELPDADLFTVPMLSYALELLSSKTSGLTADVNNPDGRKEINKTTRAVGGAIRRLDERRAKYVAELKKRPAEIDRLFRETFRKPAEQIQADIRAPLDAWNEEQRQAEKETTRLIDEIQAPIEAGTRAADIAARLEATRNMELPDWVSETQRNAITAAMNQAIPRLETVHAAALQTEKQAAEIERLRKIEHEAELARAREEVAERARAEATAAARQEVERAERRAQEAEAAAEIERRQREAEEITQRITEAERLQSEAEAFNRRITEIVEARASAALTSPEPDAEAPDNSCLFCGSDSEACNAQGECQVHRIAAADLEFAVEGLTAAQATAIVAAIARGDIPNLAVRYF